MDETDLDSMTLEEVQAYNVRLGAAEIANATLLDSERYHLFEIERDIVISLIGARQRRGLSQADLADKVGCTRTTINRIECGKTSPSLKLLLRIADQLGIGVALLTKPKDRVTK